MKNTLFKGFIVASVIFASGCANTNKQMYTWGQYEDLVYEFHNTDSSIEPQKQIAMLQEAVAEAKKTNKEISTGQHRKINLLKEPFNLDSPFYKIQEMNNEHNPDQDNFIYIYKN